MSDETNRGASPLRLDPSHSTPGGIPTRSTWDAALTILVAMSRARPTTSQRPCSLADWKSVSPASAFFSRTLTHIAARANAIAQASPAKLAPTMTQS